VRYVKTASVLTLAHENPNPHQNRSYQTEQKGLMFTPDENYLFIEQLPDPGGRRDYDWLNQFTWDASRTSPKGVLYAQRLLYRLPNAAVSQLACECIA